MALLAKLLYGTGMRLREGLRLRVKDIDFDQRAIIVREGKGGKDRVVMLPDTLATPLREQLARARVLWSSDRTAGVPGVSMPDALARKYPRAASTWAWHWVFPSPTLSVVPDPKSSVATMCIPNACNARSGKRWQGLVSTSPFLPTPYAIASQPTCLTMVMTSEPYRSYSGIQM
jgi:integrase